MNKKFTLFIVAVLSGIASLTANAQNIKGDFDSPWVKDTKGNGALPGMYLRPGVQPQGWEASNVHQKVLLAVEDILVTQDADRLGKTDGYSVKMENKSVGVAALGITSPAPGYITLGTPWVYAIMDLSACDGGTVGGVEFVSRPDSLVGFYKRTLAEGTEPENALILAYFWKGTSISNVPVNPKGGLTSDETQEVQDQDLCILGKKEAGGNAQLIGKAEYIISKELKDWSRISIPVEYNGNTAAPEKANIIISACNYWNRSEIVPGNSLWADDVKFIYNTKLKSVTLDGEELSGFDEDTFEYFLPYADKDKEINAHAYGATASIGINQTEETGVVVKTVTVTCNETAGEKQLTYTFTFRGEPAKIETPTETPVFIYGDAADNIGFTSNSNAPFTYKSDNESVIKYDNTNNQLIAVGVGTANITAYQSANENFSSAVSTPINVTVNKAPLKISIKDAWCERGVSVSETNVKNGTCGYTLVYDGFVNEENESVLTTPVKVTSAASKEPETVGSTRAVTLSAAAAENYEITYATDQTLTIKKTTLSVYVEYANKSLNSMYNYKEIIAPIGLDKCPLHVSYLGFKYNDDAASVFGENLPTVNWTIQKSDPAGTEGTASLTFPVMELENYNIKNCIPEDGKVIVKTAPKLEIAETELNVTYGHEPVPLTITTDEGAKVYFTPKEYTIAAVVSGAVTFKQAGVTSIIAYISPKGELSGIEKEIKVNIAKAPLTVKATDVELIIGSEAPETFELTYEGLVNDDKARDAFLTLPTAVLENEIPSTVKVGDQFDIIVTPGISVKYEVTYANGKLTVVKDSGIDGADAEQGIYAYATNGNLYIKGNIESLPISIYNTQGALVGRYNGNNTVITANLAVNTVYIVKIGSYVTRVLVK